MDEEGWMKVCRIGEAFSIEIYSDFDAEIFDENQFNPGLVVSEWLKIS